jgi:cytochrome c-type biogenesis protein CcmE
VFYSLAAVPRSNRKQPMSPKQRRALFIVIGLAVAAAVLALVLNAFKQNLVFFFTPSQIAANEAPKNKAFRLGGLVTEGSLVKSADGLSVGFQVTDTKQSVKVSYKGILPDLFKEGKGVVAQGQIDASGVFIAAEVLAKHDENYMPPEAAEALKKAGHVAPNK